MLLLFLFVVYLIFLNFLSNGLNHNIPLLQSTWTLSFNLFIFIINFVLS